MDEYLCKLLGLLKRDCGNKRTRKLQTVLSLSTFCGWYLRLEQLTKVGGVPCSEELWLESLEISAVVHVFHCLAVSGHAEIPHRRCCIVAGLERTRDWTGCETVGPYHRV